MIVAICQVENVILQIKNAKNIEISKLDSRK